MRRSIVSLKAISLIFSLLLLVMSATGCGKSADDTSKRAPARVEKKKPKEKIRLGQAEAKNPNPKSLIKTAAWGEVPANQIAVVLKDGRSRADALAIATKISGKIVGEIEFINLYQIETTGATEADLTAAIDEASATAGVEVAMANIRMLPDARIQGVTFDPLAQDVYSEGDNGRPYEITGVKDAWTILKTSKVKTNEVNVGVADEPIYEGTDEVNIAGVKPKHKRGVSGVSGDSVATPEKDDQGQIVSGGFNHGTMVTHVIGADPGNGGVAGAAGILGDKLKINVKNIFDADKEFTETAPDPNDPTKATATDGKSYSIKTLVHLTKLIESGATIINCSFGTTNGPGSAAYKKFFKKMAKDHPNVLFVASAGNSGLANDGKNHFPGGLKLPNLITVGAVDNKGQKADFSNSEGEGGEVTLSAPAVDMALGVGPDGKAVTASGTSFASPQVASAAALIRSINPDLTAEEIKEILTKTASPGVTNGDMSVPIADGMGSGVLNVADAVLETINEMRSKQGLPPLKKGELLALGSIEIWADGGPQEYDVQAILDRVGDDGSAVRVDLSGEGAISGNRTKTLKSAGSAVWNVTLGKGKGATVNLKRLDSGAWGYVVLPAAGKGDDSAKTKNPDAELVLTADMRPDESGLLKDMDIEIVDGKVNASSSKAAVWAGRQGQSWAKITGTYNAKTEMLDAQYSAGWDGTREAGTIVQNVKIVFTGKTRQKVSPKDKRVQINFTGNVTIEVTGGPTNPPKTTTANGVTIYYNVTK